jgi:hypothetical protein
MFRFGLLSKDRGLPRTGLLLYLKSPNGTGGDVGKYVLAAGNAALFAAVGGAGFWYTDVNTPVARTAAEIEAWSGINLNHVIFSLKGALIIYDPATEKRIIDKALKFAKEYPSSLGFNGAEDIYYDYRFEQAALRGTVEWDGAPTITADGVAPGNGPAFSDVISWGDGKILYVQFKADSASADIVGDLQVFGPVYAFSGGLKAKDGTNTATVSTSWNVGDVVTAVVTTGPILKITAQEITASKAPGAYYVENVIRNRPCWLCPSGIANYENGAYHLECSGDEGDTALTITGGDSVAHAGAAIWKCVVEYPDGELEFNIVDVVSDPTCTLVYPLKKDGPVKVWAAWQSAIGQHYSLKGVECYAETLWRLDRRYAVRNESVFSHNYTDIFTTDTWVKKNPLIWQPVGGLANNMIIFNGVLNIMTIGKRIHSGCRRAVGFTASAAGHGLSVAIPVTDAFTGRIELSTGINAESGYEGVVAIAVDGESVYSSAFGTYVKTHQVYVENAVNIVVTVTRTTGGTTSIAYRIGALHLVQNVGSAGALIDKNAKVLLCGDSWIDPAHATGAGFKSRLESLISGAGGTGTVIDGAMQGMTTRWALKWLPVYLAEHSPDICIINFFTNDNNNLAGQTFIGPDGQTYDLNVIDHAEWGANIELIVAMCKAAGCTPIVMLPDTASNESQSDAHATMQNFAGIPVLVKEWLTQATTSELANVAFVGNIRNKLAGRKITRVNDSVALVAAGTAPASPWSTFADGAQVMRVGNEPLTGDYAAFDSSMPALKFQDTAPAKLQSVKVE